MGVQARIKLGLYKSLILPLMLFGFVCKKVSRIELKQLESFKKELSSGGEVVIKSCRLMNRMDKYDEIENKARLKNRIIAITRLFVHKNFSEKKSARGNCSLFAISVVKSAQYFKT